MLDTQVLIVGAGPTGLTMACQLLRFGIRFRILDKSKNRAQESRAFAIQSRSMEIFQTLGLAKEILKLARRGIDFAFYIDGKKQFERKLDQALKQTTPFPSVYFLPQNELERILIEFLEHKGVYIERQTELVAFSQTKQGIEANIKKAVSQNVENIGCAYLIGCDGAHSTVRHRLNFSFEGASYKQSFILADASLNWSFDSHKFLFFLSKQGIFIHFPLTKNFSRLILAPHSKTFTLSSNKPKASDIETLGELITKKPLKLSNLIWLTQFRLHHRGVQSYSQGHVYLAGDAAHIHSPIGGQGMNTGIQDVTNLAWKLAVVLKRQSPEELLTSYETERHPIGKMLLKTTDRFFYFLTSENYFIPQLRRLLLPLMLKYLFSPKHLEKHLFRFVSQLNIHYHTNKFVYEYTEKADNDFKKGPRAGYRAPDAPLGDTTLFNLLARKPFHLFIFCKRILRPAELKWVKTHHDNLHDRMEIHCINFSNTNKQLWQRYGVNFAAIYIIRPDGYIGFRAYGINLTAAAAYLQQLFPYKKNESC